jgi:threonine dehydratase
MKRADALSDELGFTPDGGIWIKDETHNVAGSHKARHLFTELVYLVMTERAGVAPWKTPSERPMLAIASCGNAAIAASTLAAAVQWPIAVHVPVASASSVISKLESLHADIRVCPRLDSDPAGDPCVLRFREEVAAGAIPFGVQGTENAWCLDGGRTIGWEMLKEIGHRVDRIFIQVGGGAFASSIASSMRNVGTHPKLHAVQAEGCAPLSRAWDCAKDSGGTRDAGSRWSDCMWAWEEEPHSLADGILDDETYDWIGILNGMSDTGGSPVVASEDAVIRAHEMASRFTDISVSPTGSAGLAGVLQIRNEIADDERIVVVFSGVLR